MDMSDSQRHVPWLLSQSTGGQFGGSEMRSGCGESNVHKQSMTMCTIHGGLERETSGQNQVCCVARAHTVYRHGWKHTGGVNSSLIWSRK